MIARVVVNSSSRAPDKFYDYLVPCEFENRIFIGSKVKVSFGSHNNIVEAYVMDIKQISRAKRLKSIIDVYDRVFDDEMSELIKWLRDECVCRYIDVIKTVVPSGTVNKPVEVLVLSASADADNNDILKTLSRLGGECEINTFHSYFDDDITRKLKQLIDNGSISTKWVDRIDIKDKTVSVAQCIVDSDEIEETVDELKKLRAYTQARMLDLLSTTEYLSLADLVQFADGSYSAIRALKSKGYIAVKDIVVSRSPVSETKRDEKKTLTSEQQNVFNEIKTAVLSGEYSQFLLHGVTGSGKTEVYMQSIEECINIGKRALMLVPEIALTPQTVARFTARFGKRIAVLHSGLSLGERYDEWKRIRDKEADIVIGARSAVFAPINNVGIIIIDEEHEQSYKSEMVPRYNTSDVAKFRAKQYDAVLLSASATPKIESYYKAVNSDAKLLEITKRVNEGIMPTVDIIDMRSELSKGNNSILSEKLKNEIEINLNNKEQTILFLNRRGFSTFVSCRSCGFVAECPHCSVSLTYHKYNNTLRCHYCGYTIENYTSCPSCNSKLIRYFGGGTQKVEEEVKRLFPNASTIRMDIDTIGRKEGHSKILEKFEKENIDILIGTQMVAKGLDFPNVTLVGVVAADTSLHVDDFRSSERTFSLLEQVIGRAGRAAKPGRAIIQTYSPEHQAITLAAEHSYKEFYNSEIKLRNAMWYPPFCDMITIGFQGPSEQVVRSCANTYAKALLKLAEVKSNARMIGPIRASVSKIKNKYRWQIILKVKNNKKILSALSESMQVCRKNKLYDAVSIVADINPNSIY